MSEWLRIQDVADEYGIAYSTVRKYLKNGRLKGYKVGDRLVRITAEDSADFPVEFTVALEMKLARQRYVDRFIQCEWAVATDDGDIGCSLESGHMGRHNYV
jgi:excisionase family DNA binding protein